MTELEYFIIGLETPKKNSGNNYPTEKRVAAVISEYFGCSLEEIYGTSRKKDLVMARHMLWYILYTKRKSLSFPKLAKKYNRTSASIVHAVHKIDNWINKSNYKDVIELYNDINKQL
jgi:chromosomal replication initiator protein